MRSLKFANVRLTSVGVVAFAALLAAVACSDSSGPGQISNGPGAEQSGELGLSLQLATGDIVTSVSYTIIGPNSFSKSGSIDVSNSSTIAATISGLPAGSGYSITLSATSSNAQAQCSGSAAFSVVAHQSTPVAVSLLCHQAARTGSVSINGAINVCPTLDGINAAPVEVAVGASVTLNAIAHDTDAGPSALSYNWSAATGTLSNAQSASPSFTCTSAGAAKLTVTVSDGDAAAGCADSGSLTITCTSGNGAGGASSTGGTGGGGASSAGAANAGAPGAGSGGGGAANAGAPGAGSGGGGAANAGAPGAGAPGAGSGGGGAANAGAPGAGSGGGGASGAGAPGAGAGGDGAAGGSSSGSTNLVVYRVGDGSGSLASTGNPVFVDEFTTAGALVRSTGMPTAPHRLVASGTATSEGFITRSSNGKYVLLTGYDSTIPMTGLASTASNVVNRTVGRLDASGAVDTSTGLTDAATGNNPRSVASVDGSSVWLTGGAGGIRFANFGAGTSVQLSTTVVNLRQVNIFGGQLFVSDASGSAVRVGTVGSGLPTTSGQTISNLPGFPTSTGSPYGFFLADLDPNTPGLDVAYVADDGVGLLKYSLVGGTWIANGTLGAAADAYRGLTGSVSGNTVTLYSTRKGGSGATGGGELVQVIDAGGYNTALSGTPALLATAAANTAFRGVAFAPQP